MPTNEDRERNIENVIATAICCFKEHGIEATSQIMIAHATGLSPRSIQRYFSCKTELVIQAIKHVVNHHCGQLISKFEEYDRNCHSGLQNLIYLINLHSVLLEHNTELFIFLNEADMYLIRNGINGDSMLMSIPSVCTLKNLFDKELAAGISDKSIRKDIDVAKESMFLNVTLTGLLYQLAAHSSNHRINESHNLQRELINNFTLVWEEHLKGTIR